MKKRWPRATAPAATVWDNKKQRDASQASRLSASKKYDLDCLHWEQVVKIMFRRGRYLAEHTLQAASVEFVHLRGTNYARSRLQKPVGKP